MKLKKKEIFKILFALIILWFLIKVIMYCYNNYFISLIEPKEHYRTVHNNDDVNCRNLYKDYVKSDCNIENSENIDDCKKKLDNCMVKFLSTDISKKKNCFQYITPKNKKNGLFLKKLHEDYDDRCRNIHAEVYLEKGLYNKFQKIKNSNLREDIFNTKYNYGYDKNSESYKYHKTPTNYNKLEKKVEQDSVDTYTKDKSTFEKDTKQTFNQDQEDLNTDFNHEKRKFEKFEKITR